MRKGSHVDGPGIQKLLEDAGVTGAEFCRHADIAKDVWLRIKRGHVHVTQETADRLVQGLRSLPGYPVAPEVIALLVVPLAQGHVRIIGDAEQTRERLRLAARKHGETTFSYLVELFGHYDDPLLALEEVAGAGKVGNALPDRGMVTPMVRPPASSHARSRLRVPA